MEKTPKALISKNFGSEVVKLIEKARDSIDIIVYDWRFYPNDLSNPVTIFNNALVTQIKKGVKIRCLVNNKETGAILRGLGFKVKTMESKKILHTKLMIIDNKTIIIGSHNYTQNAFSNNYECSVAFCLDNDYNEFIEYFNFLYGL